MAETVESTRRWSEAAARYKKLLTPFGKMQVACPMPKKLVPGAQVRGSFHTQGACTGFFMVLCSLFMINFY